MLDFTCGQGGHPAFPLVLCGPWADREDGLLASGHPALPQVDVQLQVTVPRPGHYALVVEYANEDARQEVGVAVHTPQQPPQLGVITLHPCPYRWAGSMLGVRMGQPWAARTLTVPPRQHPVSGPRPGCPAPHGHLLPGLGGQRQAHSRAGTLLSGEAVWPQLWSPTLVGVRKVWGPSRGAVGGLRKAGLVPGPGS